jgi:hypothetical protein
MFPDSVYKRASLKDLPEKEHSGTFKKSKLFPDNRQQMEHDRLLMFPENQYFINALEGALTKQLVKIYRRYVDFLLGQLPT